MIPFPLPPVTERSAALMVLVVLVVGQAYLGMRRNEREERRERLKTRRGSRRHR